MVECDHGETTGTGKVQKELPLCNFVFTDNMYKIHTNLSVQAQRYGLEQVS